MHATLWKDCDKFLSFADALEKFCPMTHRHVRDTCWEELRGSSNITRTTIDTRITLECM